MKPLRHRELVDMLIFMGKWEQYLANTGSLNKASCEELSGIIQKWGARLETLLDDGPVQIPEEIMEKESDA